MTVLVDSSVWIDFFSGRPSPQLERALEDGAVVLPPLVLAELVSGARTARERETLNDSLGDLPLHPTTREHWVRVGELRRALASRGIAVSIPDAHIAQCALDAASLLLSRDAVFAKIAAHTPLRLVP